LYDTGHFIRTKINVPENITVGQDKKVLHLNAAVVYLNSHYTCYFKSSNVWYYYDDLDNETTEIGNYYQLLEARPSVEKNGTLLFYTM